MAEAIKNAARINKILQWTVADTRRWITMILDRIDPKS
jgi:hypothetical protein